MAARAQSKAGALYGRSWHLVEFVASGRVTLEEVDPARLPKTMRVPARPTSASVRPRARPCAHADQGLSAPRQWEVVGQQEAGKGPARAQAPFPM